MMDASGHQRSRQEPQKRPTHVTQTRAIQKLTEAATEFPRGPTLEIEESLRQEHGYTRIAGTDEAGRGPIAGPVAAAVVVLPNWPSFSWLAQVDDSKRLAPALRERLARHILDNCYVGSALLSARQVDALGIGPATRLAMLRSLDALLFVPDYLLVDYPPLPEAPCPHRAIVHGDALSISIACASIVAKVLRDRLMTDLDVRFPGYNFAQNKGYATSEHLAALRRLGPCPIHRRTFAPVRDLLGARPA